MTKKTTPVRKQDTLIPTEGGWYGFVNMGNGKYLKVFIPAK